MIALSIAVSISLSRFIEVYDSQSIGWDSASFLANGAAYAGDTIYNQAFDPTRPPVIPVILSLMFRVTGPSASDGYILSGLLYFLAILGCYFLAREIMNPWLALLPAASYGLAPMVVEWAGIVYSNVEGTAIAALGLATFSFGIRTKKAWCLFLTLPLFVIATLSRYTMGVVIFAAIIYLITSKSARETLKKQWKHLAGGLALASVVFFALATYWLGFPSRLGIGLANLFPAPQQPNPFQSPRGRAFFAVSLPAELGIGRYGILMTFVFIASSAYALVLVYLLAKSSRIGKNKAAIRINQESMVRKNEYGVDNENGDETQERLKLGVDPLVYALLTWFFMLFVYYSLIWPYYDPRYSVEFVMPALILAYWGVSKVLSRIYRLGAEAKTRRFLKVTVTFLVVALIVFVFSAEMFASSTAVIESTPVIDSSVSAGFREATGWIKANVPQDAHIEGDWYTFLQWYLPQYNITAAPVPYQLQTYSQYQSWLSSIANNGISYVVYSDPSAIQIPPELHPVFTSSVGDVVVFSVGA